MLLILLSHNYDLILIKALILWFQLQFVPVFGKDGDKFGIYYLNGRRYSIDVLIILLSYIVNEIVVTIF